jgi:hypothetical protein
MALMSLWQKLSENMQIRPANIFDVSAAVELYLACVNLHQGYKGINEEKIREEWIELGGDLEANTRLVLTAEGRVIGYIEVKGLDEPVSKPWMWGCVHPEFEGGDIEECLMAWAEARIRQESGRIPDEARIAMHTAASCANPTAKRLFEQRAKKLNDQKRNSGTGLEDGCLISSGAEKLEVRLFDPMQIRKNTALHDHKRNRGCPDGEEAPFLERFPRWWRLSQENHRHDPEIWLLARDRGIIAGTTFPRSRIGEDVTQQLIREILDRNHWGQQISDRPLTELAKDSGYAGHEPACEDQCDTENPTIADDLRAIGFDLKFLPVLDEMEKALAGGAL